MQELISAIVDLLSKHTCVIIPDFGGFIVNEKGAFVSSNGDHFSPPQKELIFNSHLTHNDGLLAQAFMRERSISFEEANKIITEKVQNIKKELAVHKMYGLGDFGFFSLEKNGVVFHAKNIEIENREAFGLREFYFPTIRMSDAKMDDFREIPVNQTRFSSSVSKIVMGGIAATIALFLLCQPIQNEGEKNYASLVPVPSFSDIAIHNMETAKNKVLKTKELGYYLIVKEFESEEQALLFRDSVELQEGDFLPVLAMNEKFFIAFSSPLDSLAGIQDRMADLHSRYTIFPDAFILGLP